MAQFAPPFNGEVSMQLYQGKQQQRPQRRKGRSPWKIALVGVAFVSVVALLAFAGYFFYLMATLPKVDRLADYKPPIVSQVFGDDDTLVGEFYLERRTVVPVDKLPRRLIQAFVAAEDSNFFQHKGIDYLGVVRAATKNLLSMRKKEGASTITQQVAKSMLLTPEKKYSRKIKEAILADAEWKKGLCLGTRSIYITESDLPGRRWVPTGSSWRRKLFRQGRGESQPGGDGDTGRTAEGPQFLLPDQAYGKGA